MTTHRPQRLAGRLSPATMRLAGIAYLCAWIAGLSVFSSSTTVSSSGTELFEQYRGHAVRLAVQFALTEGAAGIALAIVTAGLAARIDDAVLARVVAVCGSAAAAVSLSQCAIGLYLCAALVPDRDIRALATASDTLSRLDGLKMTLLAATTAALAAAVRRGRIPLPRWTGVLSAATAVSLIASALGYGLLNDTAARAAWLSLPLLIATVTGSALLLVRRPGPAPSR